MNQSLSQRSLSTPATRISIKVASVLAACFGLLLIWGVGFAYPSAIHNAAHDTRHSISFPCH